MATSGILRYRGYPIEQLAEDSDYLETAYLLLYGELPSAAQQAHFNDQITMHTMLHENVKKFMEGFRYDAHPMGIFLSTVGALSTFYPDAKRINDAESRQLQTRRLIAKMPTIAAYAFRHIVGRPYIYPDNDLSLHRQLPEHAVQDAGREVPPEHGARARARRPVHPARRSRAELQHQRDAQHRQLARRIRTRRSPARRQPSTARCTAAPTRRCCGC